MKPEDIIFYYAIGVVVLSIPLALWLDSRRIIRESEYLRYRWGYYLGLLNLGYLPVAVLVLLGWTQNPSNIAVATQVLCCFARPVFGFGAIRRKRWGWVGIAIMGIAGFAGILHLLSLIGLVASGILWKINFRYARKHWHNGEWGEPAA